MTDTLNLSRVAISELIADGIREYEMTKGAKNNATGHKDLGHILMEHMKMMSVSRTQLAEQSGVTANYITKIILGDRMPTPTILARMSRVLGEQFLLDWYYEVGKLDDASKELSAKVHLVIGGRAILQKTYDKMVRDCSDGNEKAHGQRNESECRRSVDLLIRQYPERYGVPVAAPA